MAIIEVKDLTFKYPNSKEPALKNVSLTVERGEIVVVMGPTGAGKSTLAYCLNGTIPHFIEGGEFKGTVKVCGMDTREHPIRILAQKVGLVFDDPEIQMFGMKVFECVAFGPANLGVPLDEINKRVKYSLEACRLKGFEYRNPYQLSGGEKQSVSIASALAMLPEVLVLDEATAMLDPLGRERIYSVVKELNEEYGITFIVITQDSEEVAPIADRIVIMDKGRILLDKPPREAFREVELLEKVGIRIPPVVYLANKLREKGLWSGETPLTVEEAKEIMRKLVKKKVKPPEEKKVEAGKPIIRVENVSFVYPGGVKALSNVSLTIREGEITAIIGQNGSGKTTLAKLLNGLLKPTEGKVLVEGVETTKKTVAELSKVVGYVYQNPDLMLFSPTVEEELAFGPRNLGVPEDEIKERIKLVLEKLKITKYRRTPPSMLPRGIRKRVALGSILTMKPKVVVVDEPTTGQDWLESLWIMDILKELNNEGHTILVISHDMELVARYTNRVIMMSQGRILIDSDVRTAFTMREELSKASIAPPQAARLAQELSDLGIPPTILHVEELLEVV